MSVGRPQIEKMPAEIVPGSGLLDPGYAGLPGAWDELRDGEGHLRLHWRRYMGCVERLGLRELDHRREQATRHIRENGVTYNVYTDPRGTDRPWELDPVPFLVGPSEWSNLEAALVQRCTLLNLILADLYGEQKLLAGGLLPPELVFGSQKYLRPCRGVPVPANRYLHLYAADLARSPDGQWWVIADRTEAPSGTGYALENRLILSRIFPNVFAECQVQRLAGFFRSLQSQMSSLAPRHGENPHIVLLTPGPYNETYFEHAYLARYLGFSLVEGGDLTVRDNGVFLKTLGGLHPVDVILRRVDDAFCDPLELRGDSSLGIPGLIQALRRGHVAVANAIGSGVIETSAIMAFLPSLCQHLLGEELRMPSVATWWCGQEPALTYVLEHLDDLVIKPSFPGSSRAPVFGDQLSSREKAGLADRIRARPGDFVGQERVRLSSVPAWSTTGLQPRPMVLRTYVTAASEGYIAMPGGLTRMSADAGTPVVSMQSGGGSKDTWVLSDKPVEATTLLRVDGRPIKPGRGLIDLPSRVADNLFWLGRYVERAENTARLARTALEALTSGTEQGGAPEMTPLLRAMAVMGHLESAAIAGPDRPPSFDDLERALVELLMDEAQPKSLAFILSRTRSLSRMVRDRLSSDTWRILNRLDRHLHGAGGTPVTHTGEALSVLDGLIINLAAFSGVSMENMSRGQGWRLLDMGRRIERAQHLVDLLGATLVSPVKEEAPLLEGLLRIADSFITYRARYLSRVQTSDLLELLLIDETYPRAVGFQLAALSEHVQHMPREDGRGQLSGEQKIMVAALSAVRLADPESLSRVYEVGNRTALHALLSDLRHHLPALANSITRRYLSHVESPRQLASSRGSGEP